MARAGRDTGSTPEPPVRDFAPEPGFTTHESPKEYVVHDKTIKDPAKAYKMVRLPGRNYEDYQEADPLSSLPGKYVPPVPLPHVKTPSNTWVQGDFYDNLAASVDSVGFGNLGVAFGLAHVPFASVKDREDFLHALSRVPLNDVIEA